MALLDALDDEALGGKLGPRFMRRRVRIDGGLEGTGGVERARGEEETGEDKVPGAHAGPLEQPVCHRLWSRFQ
ncbi:hypothetical protein D3C83_161740 [compost metagenome]